MYIMLGFDCVSHTLCWTLIVHYVGSDIVYLMHCVEPGLYISGTLHWVWIVYFMHCVRSGLYISCTMLAWVVYISFAVLSLVGVYCAGFGLCTMHPLQLVLLVWIVYLIHHGELWIVYLMHCVSGEFEISHFLYCGGLRYMYWAGTVVYKVYLIHLYTVWSVKIVK